MAGEHPTGAAILGFLGGFLCLVEGLLLGAASSSLYTAGYAGAGAAVGGVGAAGDFFGFLIIVFSILAYRIPDSHVGLGIVLLILGLASIFGGGGFLLGLIFTVIAGILAIVFVPEDEVDADDVLRGDLPPPWVTPAASAGGSAAPAPAVSPAPRPVPAGAGRTCPTCHTVFEKERTYCPQCGAYVP